MCRGGPRGRRRVGVVRRHRLGDGRVARVKVPCLYRYLASDAMVVPSGGGRVQEHALTRLTGVFPA